MINRIRLRSNAGSGNAGYLFLLVAWTLFVGGILGLGVILSGREARAAALNIARDRFELNRLIRMAGPAQATRADLGGAGPSMDSSSNAGADLESGDPVLSARLFQGGKLESAGFLGHLASLRSPAAGKAQEPWEQKAIQGLQAGAGEYWEVAAERSGSVLRFMKPLVAGPECLACHGGQGYRDGAVIGSISLVVPMKQDARLFGGLHNLATMLVALAFWGMGLGALRVARNWQETREQERAQALAALQASEALYRELLERQGEGFAVVDGEERFVMVNGVAEGIFGAAPGTLTGRSLLEFLSEDQRDLVRSQSALRAEGRSSTYELEIRREGDGAARTLLVTATPGRDGDDHPMQAIGVIRDITERRLAEEALRRSEADMQAVLAAAAAGILAIDHERRVVHVNRRFAEIWQIPQDLIEQRLDEQLLAFVLSRLADPAAFMAKVDALYGSELEDFDTIVCLDGRTIERFSQPLLMDKQVIGRVWSFLDVSDRIRAEAERGRLQDQLSHARRMESLGNLAGGVAHDMNNVLAAILGVASSHLTVHAEGSPAHRAFGLIGKAAARGATMIQGLLQFARQSPAEDRPIDMNEILLGQAHVLRCKPLALEIETDLALDLHSIRGDASALTIALLNICNNAAEAMAAGGRLTLRSRNQDQEWIEVRVEDEGPGMAREVLDRAFDPFFTTKEQGTGLGLALAYTTVTAHKGEIEIHSEPGLGTQVTLRLPRGGSEN
jgi:PAS domain S-box-containing protein